MAFESAGRLDLVQRRAEEWADELIDFGPNNGLLYFKTSRSLTIDLTDCPPAERGKLLRGRQVRLSALFPDADAQSAVSKHARSLQRKITMLMEEQGLEVGRLARSFVTMDASKAKGATPVRALRSPLLLQNIRLVPRTAAEQDFVLEVDGDPEVNPVLLIALYRHFGLDLDVEATAEKITAVMEETPEPESYPHRAFDVLKQALHEGNAPVVGLDPREFVGCFSFEKLPMVQDLRNSADLLAQHEIVCALAGDSAGLEELRSSSDEVVESSDRVALESEYLVLDADSSQQEALSAVMAGKHVVIQGPPGTGKSQTIANIIAAAAAEGRRTLFVAEKRAAIEAVTELLASADLDQLVFDLHGSKLNKRAVAQQVATSLEELGRALPPDVDQLHMRLSSARQALLNHHDEMHSKRAPWGLSTYQVLEGLQALPSSAHSTQRVRGKRLRELDAGTVETLCRELSAFVHSHGLAVQRGESAWSAADVRDQAAVERTLAHLDAVNEGEWRRTQYELGALVARSGLREPDDFAGWGQVFRLLSGVAHTIELYDPDIFKEDLHSVCAAVGDKAWREEHPTGDGWWKRYKIRRRIAQRRRAGSCSRSQLFDELRDAYGLGLKWNELATDQAGTPQLVELGDEFRSFSMLRDDAAALAQVLRLEGVDEKPISELKANFGQLAAEKNVLFRLPELNRIIDVFDSYGLDGVLHEIASRNLDADSAQNLLKHVWHSSLLEQFQAETPSLGAFSGLQHDSLASEFRQLDRQHFILNAARVRRRVALRLRDARDKHPAQNERVLKEANKASRHMALRRFLSLAPDVLLTARPCWAMSPIVVSRLLPSERLFDLVIFDEGSQVEPVDAITSIMRGSQLVVSGDDKQLPPSGYFKTLSGGDLSLEEDDDLDEDKDEDRTQVRDFESVLTCLASFVPHVYRLRWHYRSVDERLIAFSNREFYGNQLITFPGRHSENPIELHTVQGASAPGAGGLIDEEVRHVVSLVVDHVRSRPQQSLGIITANVKHMDRVEGALRVATEEHPEISEFRSHMEGPRRRLFVKSLELVQGDERDVVILSIGRAKGADGRLSMRFGPLNNQGGERRLNVAITRARRKLHVVSAFTHEDMSPDWPAEGPEMLRRFLTYASQGGSLRGLGRQVPVALNHLEQEVFDRLVSLELPVVPQWGVSDYRIDFALGDPARPGRMVLAVELDGDTYHRLASVRDRDRLRQEHLERLGWRFHRIWASEWMSRPDEEAARVKARWEAVLQEPTDEEIEEASSSESQASTSSLPARGPRPMISRRQDILAYADDELYQVARWLLGDGLPLDRQTRLAQMRDELGFRSGSRINHRCGQALDAAKMEAGGNEKA